MGKQTTMPASDAGDSKPQKKAGLLPRLSVPLTADKSKFAVENMTDPVRDRLRAVLADPELRTKLQLPEERPPAAAGELMPESWDAGITGLLYETLGKLLVMMAGRQGYTPGEAALLEFSEAEKSQLAAPTAAVLDKYFPGGLSRYGPEVVLAGALLVVMQGKLFTLRRVAAERLAGAPGANVHEFRPPAAASVQ